MVVSLACLSSRMSRVRFPSPLPKSFMGYFANSTEHERYQSEYCARCFHGQDDDAMCAVMELHFFRNYEECNNKDSALHVLIPRDKQGWNQRCRMFIDQGEWQEGLAS